MYTQHTLATCMPGSLVRQQLSSLAVNMTQQTLLHACQGPLCVLSQQLFTALQSALTQHTAPTCMPGGPLCVLSQQLFSLAVSMTQQALVHACYAHLIKLSQQLFTALQSA
jgi:hypothetical protein